MYRLAISPASSGSCLSNFLVVSRNPSTSKTESSTTTSTTSSSMAYRRQRRRRGVYLVFILLLALLGATTSHCKLIEYICQRLGKQNQCEVSPHDGRARTVKSITPDRSTSPLFD